jgi:hypothetical protein
LFVSFVFEYFKGYPLVSKIRNPFPTTLYFRKRYVKYLILNIKLPSWIVPLLWWSLWKIHQFCKLFYFLTNNWTVNLPTSNNWWFDRQMLTETGNRCQQNFKYFETHLWHLSVRHNATSKNLKVCLHIFDITILISIIKVVLL